PSLKVAPFELIRQLGAVALVGDGLGIGGVDRLEPYGLSLDGHRRLVIDDLMHLPGRGIEPPQAGRARALEPNLVEVDPAARVLEDAPGGEGWQRRQRDQAIVSGRDLDQV